MPSVPIHQTADSAYYDRSRGNGVSQNDAEQAVLWFWANVGKHPELTTVVSSDFKNDAWVVVTTSSDRSVMGSATVMTGTKTPGAIRSHSFYNAPEWFRHPQHAPVAATLTKPTKAVTDLVSPIEPASDPVDNSNSDVTSGLFPITAPPVDTSAATNASSGTAAKVGLGLGLVALLFLWKR